MPSNTSGNKNINVRGDSHVSIHNGSSSTKRHAAVSNPVPGKGGKGSGKGGKGGKK